MEFSQGLVARMKAYFEDRGFSLTDDEAQRFLSAFAGLAELLVGFEPSVGPEARHGRSAAARTGPGSPPDRSPSGEEEVTRLPGVVAAPACHGGAGARGVPGRDRPPERSERSRPGERQRRRHFT